MGIMRKYFNSDQYHQYIIDDDQLFAIDMYFEKNLVKDCMLKLLQYNHNSECLLMNENELKKYNFPVNMYCVGEFNVQKNENVTVNYLIPNNKLLFLLNCFYQKAEKNESLNNDDLNILYNLEKQFIQMGKQKEVNIINELKNNIVFVEKGVYNHKDVENITVESINVLVRENLCINVLNISGILENARDNTNIIKKLKIEFKSRYQKTKA